jgi:glycosyltransferase involved in cell wall biosynthesis
MIFGIITHTIHKMKEGQIFAYEPYVREMNLWGKHVDKIIIIAPISFDEIRSIEIPYVHPRIKVVEIPNFDITSIENAFRSILVIPKIYLTIYQVMQQVNHIHLRCPGNIGLLGCIVQVFFPSKIKTAKYAGNWDPNSKQPLTYKLQKWILGNTLLSKNIKVLVYGKWPKHTKNSMPFFTASYHKHEIEEIAKKDLNSHIKLLFVGAFSIGKQPLLSLRATHKLLKRGFDVSLDMYGNGSEFEKVKKYIDDHQLHKMIKLHGNQSKEVVKRAFQNSHFLIFISKSEGWPKVIAESMFWSCLPISTKVSCVPAMLDNGHRGALINGNLDEVVEKIEDYIAHKKRYAAHVENAKKWSQQFTLDTFEKAIKELL